MEDKKPEAGEPLIDKQVEHEDEPAIQSADMCLNTASMLLRQELPEGVEFAVFIFHHPTEMIVFDATVKKSLLWPNLKRIVKKEMKKL